MTAPYTRMRTTGSLGNEIRGITTTQKWTTPLPTVGAPTYGTYVVGSLFRSGRTLETNDTVTPGYKKLSQAGQVIINNFSSVEVQSTALLGASCGYTVKSPPTTPSVGGVVAYDVTGKTVKYAETNNIPSVSPSTVDVENAKLLAGTAAQAGIEEPKVQGLVDLAEMRKTIQMLRKPLQQLTILQEKQYKKYLKYLRRTSFKDRKSFVQWMSSRWLEIRYGYTPLLSSIQGTIKAIQEERKHTRKTSRGSSTLPTQTGYSQVTSNDGIWSYVFTANRSITTTVRAGVLYENYFSLRNDLGLSVQEIPSTMWELVPYSFVADWFVNVADYLRAVTPKYGVRELGSWTTTITEDAWTMGTTVTTVGSSAYYSYYGGGQTWKLSRNTKTKTRLRGLKVGLGTRHSENHFERPKDFKRLADAVALLAQKFLGK